MKYIVHKGMQTIELDSDVDSVGIHLDNGAKFELQFRKSDKTISLNSDQQLIIKPVAANVVRISNEKF